MRLTGDRPRTLPPVRPPPEFVEAVNFLEPIVTRPAIDRAVGCPAGATVPDAWPKPVRARGR